MKRIEETGGKMLNNLDSNELMMILVEKYKKYTVNDHSSITVEKAQQLMSSILYCINHYLKSLDEGLVSSNEYNNAMILYEKGLELGKENLSNAKKLYKKVKNNILNIDNIYYKETLSSGIGLFFRNYDILYEAHETPGSIDYPLAIPISNLNGVEYMLEYLNRIYTENMFCSYFSINDIESLLRGYNENYNDIPLNIFEILVRNAIGLEMLGKSVIHLSISDYERDELYIRLKSLSIEDIQEKLVLSINEILKLHKIENERQKSYIIKVAIELSHEIKQALSIGRLEKIFVSSNYSTIYEKDIFIDGEMMELDEFRDFIEELKDCRYISDKIAMIKKSIRSISDLMDILDNCIWQDEYDEVFALLNSAEKKYIYEQIESEISNGIDEKDLNDWQKLFLRRWKNI